MRKRGHALRSVSAVLIVMVLLGNWSHLSLASQEAGSDVPNHLLPVALNTHGDPAIEDAAPTPDSEEEHSHDHDPQVESSEQFTESYDTHDHDHDMSAEFAPSVSLQAFSSHRLPWRAGIIGYVTQKGGTGHTNQLDFDIQGSGVLGDVVATKPGTVVFAKRSSNSGSCNSSVWQQANMVVVQHGPSEYSWYVHLAHNSVTVNVGQSVNYGTKLGVEGNTGYSCGVHLHYMVSTGHTAWTDPNNPNAAPWATGVGTVDFHEVSWSAITVGQGYVSQNGSSGGNCSNAPNLGSPGDGATVNTRNPTFSWSPPSGCSPNGYTLRVTTGTGPEQGILLDTGVSNTSYNQFTFSGDGTFYWHVRVCQPCTPYQPGAWASRRVVINTSTPPPPGGTWNARYYQMENFQAQQYSQQEAGPFIFRDWGGGSPQGIDPDTFSVQWDGNFHFQGGNYTFYARHDDALEVCIDGCGGTDDPFNYATATQRQVTKYVSPGTHHVIVRYQEFTGSAHIAFWWEGPGYSVPREARDVNRWHAQYYPTRNLGPYTIAEQNVTSGNLSLNWGNGSPGWNMPADNFSARFQRDADFSCGTYRFFIGADDGIRAWVGSTVVTNRWQDQSVDYDVTVSIPEGRHTVRVEYYEAGGGARVAFRWEKVSDCQLSPPTLVAPASGASLPHDHNLAFSWNAVSGATEYMVEWWGGPYEPMQPGGWSSATSRQIGQVAPGHTYSWRVKARNSSLESAWSPTRTFTIQAPPVQCGANQYTVEYFNNTTLSGSPVWTTCDNWPIRKEWGTGGPGNGVNNDNFSARWTANVYIAPGTYDFRSAADDVIRVWIGNEQIFDRNVQVPSPDTVRRTLAGGTYSIRVEFVEYYVGALAYFEWAPADDTPPTVTWISPVTEGDVHVATGGTVTLRVNATDNVGVTQVRFWRWDHPTQRAVDIATVTSAPYQLNLNVNALYVGWNEINADAVDAAGNVTSRHIWIVREEPGDASMHVENLRLYLRPTPSTTRVFTRVDVASHGTSVGGATVTLRITNPNGTTSTYSATTNADGYVMLAHTANTQGTYVATIVNVSHADYQYSPEFNTITERGLRVRP